VQAPAAADLVVEHTPAPVPAEVRDRLQHPNAANTPTQEAAIVAAM
jgi:hypothetical protein